MIGDMYTAFIESFGHTLYEVVDDGLPCSCGANDGLVMEVVSNDNFCLCDDEVIVYNHKQYTRHTFCLKALNKDLKTNTIRKLSASQVLLKRKNLLDNES